MNHSWLICICIHRRVYVYCTRYRILWAGNPLAPLSAEQNGNPRKRGSSFRVLRPSQVCSTRGHGFSAVTRPDKATQLLASYHRGSHDDRQIVSIFRFSTDCCFFCLFFTEHAFVCHSQLRNRSFQCDYNIYIYIIML